MKKTISILTLMALSFIMSACGSSSSGGNGGNNNANCPGATSIVNGVCYYDNGVNNPGGNSPMHTFYDARNGGYMRITNTAAYKEFLKYAMGVCDRATYTSGIYSCDSWVGGNLQLDVQVNTSSNTASFGFTAGPAQNWYSYGFYFGVVTNAWAINPLVLNQGTYSLINNSQGFELRSYGSSANGGGLKLIQLQAKNTTLGTNNHISYELYFPYNNQPTRFATGRLIRR